MKQNLSDNRHILAAVILIPVLFSLLFCSCRTYPAATADPVIPSPVVSPELFSLNALPTATPVLCTPTPTTEPTAAPAPSETPKPADEILFPSPSAVPKSGKSSPAPSDNPEATPKPAFYLNFPETEIYGGGVCQLVAYCYSDDQECTTATWKSSDRDIARVDEYGVVVGLKRGTAVITGKANDGSGHKATCAVTVTSDRPQPKSKISVKNEVYSGTKPVRENAKEIEKYIESLDSSNLADSILLSALRYVGYYYGTKEGNIDCSMLLYYACLDNGITIARRSDWQAETLRHFKVDYSSLKPGDFMFFAYKDDIVCSCSTAPVCKRYLGIHHAAVYLGKINGTHYLVEASSKVGRVCIRPWDGNSDHAGMDIVLCGRPSKLK